MRCLSLIAWTVLPACGEESLVESRSTEPTVDWGDLDSDTDMDTDADSDSATDTDTDTPPAAAVLDLGSPMGLACALHFRVEHDAWGLPGTATLTPDGGEAVEVPIHWNGNEGRVVGLHAGTTYTLAIALEGTPDEPEAPTLEATATTDLLPADLPYLSLDVRDEARASGGLTVFPVARWTPFVDMGWGYIIAVDAAGEVVWYRASQDSLFAFHVEEDDDGVPWIYTVEHVTHAVAINPFTGEERVLSAATAGIDTIHHEVRPLPAGGLAVMSTELRPLSGWGDQSYNIVGDLMVETDWDGTVSYSAAILDDVDPTGLYTEDMHAPFWEIGPYASVSSPKDWSHGNAMELDADNDQWIASFRNIDWIMGYDRTTGESMWAFGPAGDFTLAAGGRWMSRQHSPEVTPEGTLLVYDNGLARADAEPGEAPFSRVVEYHLDTEAMVATEVWSWAGDSPYLCPIVGDVDRLGPERHLITDGAVLGGSIDLGGGTVVPHFTGRVREVVGLEEPEVVWELAVGEAGATEEHGATVYRAERIPRLGPAL